MHGIYFIPRICPQNPPPGVADRPPRPRPVRPYSGIWLRALTNTDPTPYNFYGPTTLHNQLQQKVYGMKGNITEIFESDLHVLSKLCFPSPIYIFWMRGLRILHLPHTQPFTNIDPTPYNFYAPTTLHNQLQQKVYGREGNIANTFESDLHSYKVFWRLLWVENLFHSLIHQH